MTGRTAGSYWYLVFGFVSGNMKGTERDGTIDMTVRAVESYQCEVSGSKMSHTEDTDTLDVCE